MGVPKRKPSRSRQRMRRAYNSVLTLPQLSTCPAMRRAVCAAPGLPRLRLLQGPPGVDRHRGRLIPARTAEQFPASHSSMRIAVDVMGGDHGCGVVIEASSGPWRPTENHRPLPGRQPGRNPRRPASARISRPPRARHPRQRSDDDGRQTRRSRCARKRIPPSPAPPNWSARARPTRWFPSATPAASSRPPLSSWAAFPAWTAAASPRSSRARTMNLSCWTPAPTSSASRCTWPSSP